MSGLYNMLMGRNPALPYLLAALGINLETKNKYPLGRLRDAWINEEATSIFILHRNYGEDHEEILEALQKHPTFVSNTSADDHTYAWYEFGVPTDNENTTELVKAIAAETDNVSCWERYKQLIKDMEAGKDNPMTRHAEEVGKQIFKGLEKTIETGEDTSVESGDGSVDIITP